MKRDDEEAAEDILTGHVSQEELLADFFRYGLFTSFKMAFRVSWLLPLPGLISLLMFLSPQKVSVVTHDLPSSCLLKEDPF